MKEKLQRIMGKNLRRIRKEQGMSSETAAEKVGISVTFYSNLESGNRMMSVMTLYKLTQIFKVSADDILNIYHPNEKISNIECILRNESNTTIALVEKIARLCAQDLPAQEQTEKDKEIESSDQRRI